ncbi:MAG TPA: hypothetical protein VJ862_13940 [Rhodanobacteraceae bacterium]|nr:hypothetical protein [Rhodanobacteraceae bacterium]
MNIEQFVICISNDGYPASLEPRKIYRLLSEEPSEMLRVVDESGEDYLYPEFLFVRVELSDAARKAIDLAA